MPLDGSRWSSGFSRARRLATLSDSNMFLEFGGFIEFVNEVNPPSTANTGN